MIKRRNEFDGIDMINAIRQEVSPIVTRMSILEEKINELNKDRVTRSDLEKLSLAFVPRDSYEARHAQLVDRDKTFEDDLRSFRQEIAGRLIHLNERIDDAEEALEKRMKEREAAQLSAKDRVWLISSQVLGGLGLLGALFDFLFTHIKLQ